jgi:hypothetical protein
MVIIRKNYFYASMGLPSVTVGYRYQPRGTGLLFRIAFTPMLAPVVRRGEWGILP